MKPIPAKRIAVLLTTTTLLFIGAVVVLHSRHQMAAPGVPGTQGSTWRDVCFGILFGLFIVGSSLGVACIVRCASRPESEQYQCKWLCTLMTAAMLTLLFVLTILFCGPPTLPQGPIS